MNKYILMLLCICLSSCQSDIEKISMNLNGNWIITEFYYNDIDLKEKLLINSITFRKDHKFLIPELLEFEAEDETGQTYWEVIINDNDVNKKFLKLKCRNPVFKGLYQMKFFITKSESLVIILKSERTHIVAYKTDFNRILKGG